MFEDTMTSESDDEDYNAEADKQDSSDSDESGTEFYDINSAADNTNVVQKFVDYNTRDTLDATAHKILRSGTVVTKQQFFEKNSAYFTVCDNEGNRYRGIGVATGSGDVTINVIRTASSDRSAIAMLHKFALDEETKKAAAGEKAIQLAKKNNGSKKLADKLRAGDLTDPKDIVFGSGECVVYGAAFAKEIQAKSARYPQRYR